MRKETFPCIKCGEPKPQITYMSTNRLNGQHCQFTLDKHKDEHFHAECLRCRYYWTVAMYELK